MRQRITNLQARLRPGEALLLSRATDVSYFTQFHFLVPEEREALALITAEKAFLFYARFCPVKEVEGITNLVVSHPSQLADQLSQVKAQLPFATLYLDKSSLFLDEYEALAGIKELTFASLDHQWVWDVRSLKDETEVAHVTQAGQIAAQSFEVIMKHVEAGITERDFQIKLEAEMIKRGSQQPAFPTIVAFGEHTALPHHQPTERKLAPNMPVLVDFGATISNYRSDMTRTFWYGDQPAAEFTKIERTVTEAYRAALDRLNSRTAAPPLAKDVDAAARNLITKAGYGEYFIHTTGHGVGLDIHEQPSLNYRNATPIVPGMIITIEPGIYLEGQFGFRYENTVLVTEDGAKELTT
ncbi:MAG TPA: aminopeptidase P family protein [Patescibacteria group bacterium]